MKKPAGLRRVQETFGREETLFRYPIAGRAASMAGNQRHQVVAEFSFCIGTSMRRGGGLVNRLITKAVATIANGPIGGQRPTPAKPSKCEELSAVLTSRAACDSLAELTELHDDHGHEQLRQSHERASWALLLCLVYGPVRLRAAGDLLIDPPVISPHLEAARARQTVTKDQLQGLVALRSELDRIDDQILDLVERRLGASADIAAVKNAVGDRHLKVRPRRQAQILQRLKARSNRATPKLVEELWREIMAHSLQSQARTEVVIAPSDQPELLEARVRAHFGSAAPIRWASSTSDAIRSALVGEALGIISEPLADGAGELRVFDILRAEDGQAIAYAIGRVAEDEIVIDPPIPAPTKSSVVARERSPASWRDRPATQLAEYPDAGALARVETRLAGSDPLVDIADIIHLRAALSRVAQGDAFIVQGGDCAESFAEFNADKVRVTYNLLLRMGATLRAASGGDVVHLARIAGQFAKPRSSASETIDGVTLPSYRGDAVNGPDFTAASRLPDPKRLLTAHRQAQVTIELLQAYASASYADLPKVHREVGLKEPSRPVKMFTSHEALLLNYEQALARFDEASEQWWATSGHMLWIGDRTRQIDGAHVEFACSVGNPVGVKCGPSLSPDDLLRLIDRLDPNNIAGRLVLIGRFGAANIEAHLPELMRATRREGRNAIWSIDPMHGNTRQIDGLKTRSVGDIVDEITSFFAIAAAADVHPGGVHLEMTGSDVTECIGGSVKLAREDLERRYLTHCDPRLNEGQALDVAQAVAALLAARRASRADAA